VRGPQFGVETNHPEFVPVDFDASWMLLDAIVANHPHTFGDAPERSMKWV
jgi:hypothetical protein